MMQYLAKDLVKFISGRKYIRQVCNARSNIPIVLVKGNTKPKFLGEKHHYETSGGRWIYHPNAYAKSGWSNMHYVCSTLRVEVGRNWKTKKEFMDYNKTVNGLCWLLSKNGFGVVSNLENRTYDIFRYEDNTIAYDGLSLSAFRKTAIKLMKLIFS